MSESKKSLKMDYWYEFKKGLFSENPTFKLVLGMCPVLAVTTAVVNGIGMGLGTTFVLLCSNIIIALLRKYIPEKVRIPCFIVVIATFVTITDYVMAAFSPDVHKALGIFVPLIVVNCIILGRAEVFASKNRVFPSIIDALGMGIGFTLNLLLIGFIRELIGSGVLGDGTALRIQIFNPDYSAVMLILPPGAFITMGLLLALFNSLGNRKKSV